MIKEIKNFLEVNDFLEIKNLISGNNFPWYLGESKVSDSKIEKKYNWQLGHTFFINHSPCSSYFPALNPIFDKLKPLAWIKIKANLTPVFDKIKVYGMHNDIYSKENVKTGILYLNTNNGFTVFENGKKIKSEENKFVHFPANLNHSGTTHTDENYRIVLNFNWI
jgi:hypothetical protein